MLHQAASAQFRWYLLPNLLRLLVGCRRYSPHTDVVDHNARAGSSSCLPPRQERPLSIYSPRLLISSLLTSIHETIQQDPHTLDAQNNNTRPIFTRTYHSFQQLLCQAMSLHLNSGLGHHAGHQHLHAVRHAAQKVNIDTRSQVYEADNDSSFTDIVARQCESQAICASTHADTVLQCLARRASSLSMQGEQKVSRVKLFVVNISRVLSCSFWQKINRRLWSVTMLLLYACS